MTRNTVTHYSLSCKLITTGLFTDKKENLIFLIYKEVQNGAVAKSYEEGLPNI
jgi:hypothetical protein